VRIREFSNTHFWGSLRLSRFSGPGKLGYVSVLCRVLSDNIVEKGQKQSKSPKQTERLRECSSHWESAL